MDVVLTGFALLSVLFALIFGKMDVLSAAVMESGTEAVDLCLTLCGAMMLWGGIMEVAKKSGLTTKAARLFCPVLRHLFPDVAPHSEAMEAISLNVTANLFGLGNAATPLGIAAMKKLQSNPANTTATSSMVRFVMLNTASIQLLPTTVAILRQSAGSNHPLEILPAVWLSSIGSVVIGFLACMLLERRDSHELR